MKVGVTMITTDEAMSPAELARAAETRGYHSLWVPEHTHIPTSRATPAPTGEPLDEWYKRMLNPYVALAMAAAVTSDLRLGTGVALVAQHHPITLAKEIASLDLLSDGRLSLGVGFGWNREEMASHGVEFRTRRERVAEHVAAMRAIWAADRASFHGEFVAFDELWSWPKCTRPQGPPILIGGAAGPKLFDAIASYADGWIPIGGSGLGESISALRRLFEQRGRDPESLTVVPFGSVPTADKLAHFRRIGVTETVVRLPSAPADEVIRVLDQFSGFIH